ncbi:GNAT family N-acetyltransferase [Aeromicrobium camelliae]|uniref:GNAT family N-acetyltransferase n=1 Tax=Aeromicrobium camelliae TaxID=1538144 RepID=A0A3N6X7P3_9ACTN|nr:GNAT family N-acetyltransferase [Aeromicrobium camelliae]RQN10055.1 GNAT family N-acetyltransferase [Aeromicrobium camelliae]
MVIITALDVADDDAYAAFHALYARSIDTELDPPWEFRELRMKLAGDEYVQSVALVAVDGDEAVGGAWAELTLKDNLQNAFATIFVDPQHRRRGFGSALWRELAVALRDQGRTVVAGEAVKRVDAVESDSERFAETLGFHVDLVNAIRELPLPADPPKAPARDGYQLAAWRGLAPEQWRAEYAHLRSLITQEAPLGEVAWENEFWDAARLELEARQWQESGRVAQIVAAVAPHGALVGHTQLIVPDASDEVYQWDTLVLPEHRGHGLGLSLKAAAMREAADLVAGRRRITTWNAASNEPMIAVNERLGYRLIGYATEYAIDLSDASPAER